jgi:hypothetical protein
MAAVPLAANGCGGGGGGGGAAGGPGFGSGSAEGFLFRDAAGRLVLLNTSAAPAGHTAVAGATAQVVDGPGARTGADGKFRLDGIAAGLRTLRIQGGGAAPLEVPLTVVPNAGVPVGTPPIPRTVVVNLVKAFLGTEGLAGADVLVTSQPLPAGVTIHAALDNDQPYITLDRPSWLAYVDHMPWMRFGHPTHFIVIDAETGSGTFFQAESWPLLNGANFYARYETNPQTQDIASAAARAARAQPFGSGSPGFAPSSASRAAGCRAADPEEARTHALFVQGDRRRDFAEDPDRMFARLQIAPFPRAGTFRRIQSFSTSDPRELLLREFAAVRDSAKAGDTFVLYVTSHGKRLEMRKEAWLRIPMPEGATQAQQEQVYKDRYKLMDELHSQPSSYRMQVEAAAPPAAAEKQNGSTFVEPVEIDIRELDFRPCKACRIVLIIDTCYSGNWIPLARPQLDSMERKDVLILTSADVKTPAEGLDEFRTVTVGGQLKGFEPGGAFTQALLESLRGVTGDLNATEALEAAFPGARAITQAFNDESAAKWDKPIERTRQNPQMYHRPLPDNEPCIDTRYTVSGPNGGPFSVDDMLTLWHNGNVIYRDPEGASSGPRGPFRFNAKPGDTIRLQVQDWYGFSAGVYHDVYVKPAEGEAKLWFPSESIRTPLNNKSVVVDKTLTIPEPS